jgi:galactokinase
MPNRDVMADDVVPEQGLGDRFAALFQKKPRIYRAPGRVNLIGEHTDYNDGFVMPAAVGFYTWVAAAARIDRKLVIRSENLHEQVEVSLDELPAKGKHHWSDYVVGVAKMLDSSGRPLSGANLLINGNVPQGAGLSSSASLEVAVGSALLDVTGKTAEPKEVALLCQRAENEFVGARCGIMDQFIASHGRRRMALLLDCRSLEYRLLPLPEEARLVICNTMVRHSLAAGEYNKRRSECEQGVQILARHLPGVRALRDVMPADFEALSHELPEKVMRRCRHVIAENARVVQAADVLERGNLEEFGNLMSQSHQSLRDDFEVSCPELDLMVELAEKVEGVYGARMTGGGFGGCTVNLVRADCVDTFKTEVSKGYERATRSMPEIYVCSAADGVTQVI